MNATFHPVMSDHVADYIIILCLRYDHCRTVWASWSSRRAGFYHLDVHFFKLLRSRPCL